MNPFHARPRLRPAAAASPAPTGNPVASVHKADELIKDGTCAPILDKWGTKASAIESSRINPPEHTA
ncbi:hypothetical protein [Streptomyces sp. NBRC 110028]|uniref:hypothetical protein n=1 Tax=Streptomyces sp. NBRC 110028 TaxID=1621260 RepID=UPI0006E35370|nr:hypothetical protein [Streptomyces sp. NBRC 110028]